MLFFFCNLKSFLEREEKRIYLFIRAFFDEDVAVVAR
jgi:hypothetical protein